MKAINNLANNLVVLILYVIIVIPLYILFSPIIIVLYPINFFKKKRFEKEYSAFLNDNNGMNFFCYNNRKNSKSYIEKNIIPNLNAAIEIVYLNGKRVESKNVFISTALLRLKNYNRFPHLMKIRNGKLLDKSINNPFYNVLNLKKDKTELVTQINLYFEK